MPSVVSTMSWPAVHVVNSLLGLVLVLLLAALVTGILRLRDDETRHDHLGDPLDPNLFAH